MPGLVPGIHVLRPANEGVDGRDKPAMTDSAGNSTQNSHFVPPADLSRRSFRESGSEGGLTARRPLPYMPRVREIGRSAARDPVAG